MPAGDREKLMRDGYLLIRNAIPARELESLRRSYETLLDRQRAVWRRQRKPDDPPGGLWDTARQPRLVDAEKFIDAETANAVELWLSDPIRGAAAELLQDEQTAVMGMYMMCNPTFDYGPAEWHRDVDAADSGPLQPLQDSVREDGPTYLQWNIPLYDDKVFWVVPGSHVRINSDAQNRGLMTDNRSPLPGGMPVEMQAGDALVYIHYMLHWGSSYTKEPKRRTVHGGHTVFPYWEDLGFTRHLSAESRARFEVWTARTATLKDQTERALRAVADGDPRAYAQALEDLRPSASKATKLALSIWLCKAAMNMHNLKRPDFERLPPEVRLQAAAYHGITLKWGPQFAERFTRSEADRIWQRFGPLEDRLLAGEGGDYTPSRRAAPARYRVERMGGGADGDDQWVSWLLPSAA